MQYQLIENAGAAGWFSSSYIRIIRTRADGSKTELRFNGSRKSPSFYWHPYKKIYTAETSIIPPCNIEVFLERFAEYPVQSKRVIFNMDARPRLNSFLALEI